MDTEWQNLHATESINQVQRRESIDLNQEYLSVISRKKGLGETTALCLVFDSLGPPKYQGSLGKLGY